MLNLRPLSKCICSKNIDRSARVRGAERELIYILLRYRIARHTVWSALW